MGVATAAAVAGAVGSVGSAAASIAGAGKSSSGSQASQYLQALEYNQNINNTSPFIQAGQGAVNQLSLDQSTGGTAQYPLSYQASQSTAPSYTGVSSPTWTAGSAPTNQQGMMQGFSWNPTMQQLASTPGYQFTLQQGLQGVQNQYSGMGLGVSGAEQKGAASYASGLASQTYDQQLKNAESIYGENLNAYNLNTQNYEQQVNAYGQNVNAYNAQVSNYGQNINQYNQQLNAFNQQQNAYQNLFSEYWSNSINRYNQLYQLATLGSNSAANQGTSGVQSAANIGSAAQTGANAQAAGITNATSSLSNYLNSGQFTNALNSIFGNSNTNTNYAANALNYTGNIDQASAAYA